jgi:hypothetical protein
MASNHARAVLGELPRKKEKARDRESDHRVAAQISGNHLSNTHEPLGVCRFSQLCTRGGSHGMTIAAYASATLSRLRSNSGGSVAYGM